MSFENGQMMWRPDTLGGLPTNQIVGGGRCAETEARR